MQPLILLIYLRNVDIVKKQQKQQRSTYLLIQYSFDLLLKDRE